MFRLVSEDFFREFGNRENFREFFSNFLNKFADHDVIQSQMSDASINLIIFSAAAFFRNVTFNTYLGT